MKTSASIEPPLAAQLAQVVLVMGKGGVGKTTVAAGLAVLHAETHGLGLATLVEFGDGESGRRALMGAHKSVEHLIIRPADAIQRAATPLFGSATVAKLALGNFAMRPLLRAAPAIRELAMLESVRQIAAERPGVRVIVDMPATGHSLAWLRTPRQGRDWLREGPLWKLCDRLAHELIAPGRASIIVVTLPERLVLEETLELCASVAAEAELPVERIVVNRMPMALPHQALADARALVAGGGPLAGPAAELCALLSARQAARDEADAALAAITHTRHALWRLPLLPVDPSARDVARWLLAEGAG